MEKVLDGMADVCILIGMTQLQHSKGITHIFTVKQWVDMPTVSEATATSAKVKTDGVNNFVWIEGGKRVGVRKIG